MVGTLDHSPSQAFIGDDATNDGISGKKLSYTSKVYWGMPQRGKLGIRAMM
jgi:hypothetical protein